MIQTLAEVLERIKELETENEGGNQPEDGIPV